jgi:hypothetical protein
MGSVAVSLFAAFANVVVAAASDGHPRSAVVVPAGQWPKIRAGVWELLSTRTLPNGHVQKWKDTARECEDPSQLFRDYWGLGIVERSGCRYEAMQVSPTEFKITSQCMARRAGTVASDVRVSIRDEDTFELSAKVLEGRRQYRGGQIGRRVADCGDRSPKERQ